MSRTGYNPGRVIAPAPFNDNILWLANPGETGDDSAMIEELITSAGDNGVVIFPAGKTYTVKKSLPFRAGQTIIGNGATIKRADEMKSRLKSSVLGNNTVNEIEVEDPSLFQVGQECALTVDAGDTSSKYTLLNRIIAIENNTITLAQNVLDTVGGATFTTSDVLLAVIIPFSGTYSDAVHGAGDSPADVTISGFEFDGNKANNTTGLRWELQREISQLGDRSILENCYFHDGAAEGLVGLGHYGKVVNCHFKDMNGNGIHLSGGDDVQLDGITGENANIHEVNSTGDVGHQGGLIDYSTVNARAIISNVSVDGALAVIGSLGSDGDGSVLSNIVGLNCSADYIECLATLNEFVLTGGTADTCNEFRLQGDGINVKNVVCIDTPVFVACDNSNVDIVSKLVGNTSDDCVTIANDNNTVNCTVVGGDAGVAFGGGSERNRVTCTCINNFNAGLQMSGTADSVAEANIATPTIILESTFTEASTYRGIDFSQAGIIKGGSINAHIGASGRAIDVRANADNSVIDGLQIIEAGSPADLVRLNSQNNVTAVNMLFPNGTSSADAFTIGASTGFTPIDNYALGSATALTGV